MSSKTLSEKSRLQVLRSKLTAQQRSLLNEIWLCYKKTKKWPAVRMIHSRHRKQIVKEGFKPLGGNIVREVEDSSVGRQYELTLTGVLLTEDGNAYFELLVKYLNFLRNQYKEAPERLGFADKDIGTALKLSDQEIKRLGYLLTFGNLCAGISYGSDTWTILVPETVDDFPDEGPLGATLEDLIFRSFQTDLPVYIEDKQQSPNWASSLNYPISTHLVPWATPPPPPIDALKRRYQVFVSSTYEDLKEERQRVIQALLETKCIPLGMELFPAASVEQWKLIKRIIDECDYYLVVVAGRYGSVNDKGVGYTEMEFDYAVSAGKPIIGFYHKSIETLPGTKLEKADAGRKRLSSFTEKVKNRLCRSWSSADELGSAVKSAIINELEFNPKPGWIRADAVSGSAEVEKLKQRIADLEEKLKKRVISNQPNFGKGTDLIELRLTAVYDFDHTVIVADGLDEKQFTNPVTMTWDELIVIITSELQKGANIEMFRKLLDSEIKKRLKPTEKKPFCDSDARYVYSLLTKDVNSLLQTLVARKLVKIVHGITYSGKRTWENPHFRFTAKGLQHAAELQAIPKKVAE